MQVDLYIETDSKSPRTTSGWCGYVLAACKGESIHTIEGFRYVRGTNHQLMLQAIGDAMERIIKPCEITIHTSDRYLQTALEKYLPVWKENGFLTTKGEPVKYSALWETIGQQLEQHQIRWEITKAHKYSTRMRTEIERRKRDV